MRDRPAARAHCRTDGREAGLNDDCSNTMARRVGHASIEGSVLGFQVLI